MVPVHFFAAENRGGQRRLAVEKNKPFQRNGSEAGPRKALLACPKTKAAIFPRAFESSFTLRVIAMSFPALKRRLGTCPRTHMISRLLNCAGNSHVPVGTQLGAGCGLVRTFPVSAFYVRDPSSRRNLTFQFGGVVTDCIQEILEFHCRQLNGRRKADPETILFAMQKLRA